MNDLLKILIAIGIAIVITLVIAIFSYSTFDQTLSVSVVDSINQSLIPSE